MSAQLLTLRGDEYRPFSFSLTADQAREARRDFEQASIILLKAQEWRQQALRGEITPADRGKLQLIASVCLDYPRLT